MQRWQRLAIVAVVAWMLAVGAWANRSWTDTVPLTTEGGTESREFLCGAPFGSKSVEQKVPGPLPGPPVREPCEVHGERRLLAVVDLAAGALAVVALVLLGRRSAAHREPSLAG